MTTARFLRRALAVSLAVALGGAGCSDHRHALPTGIAFQVPASAISQGIPDVPVGDVGAFGLCGGLRLQVLRSVTLVSADLGAVPAGLAITAVNVYAGGGGAYFNRPPGDAKRPYSGPQWPVSGYVVQPGPPYHGVLFSVSPTKPGRYRVGPVRLVYTLDGRRYQQFYSCYLSISTDGVLVEPASLASLIAQH